MRPAVPVQPVALPARLALLLLLQPVAPAGAGRGPSLLPDGDFANGGPRVTGGHSWGVAHVSDCPCTARRGISVTAAGRRGAYADVDLPLQRGAGVVVFEAMVWCAMRSTACVRTGVGDGRAELCACPRRRLSVDFVGNPAILSLRASDPSGTELAAATQLHSAAAAAGGVGGGLGSWHLYSLRLAVPGAFASLGLRVGSGLAGGEKWKTTAEFGVVMDEGAGSLNATDFWLGYEAAETLPTPSRDRDVVGPAGMGSRSPNLLTDGSTRTPPYGPVPWEIMAYGQSLQQHTVDLGAAVPVCGVRLHQTDVKWASHWSVQAWYAPDGSGAWSGGGRRRGRCRGRCRGRPQPAGGRCCKLCRRPSMTPTSQRPPPPPPSPAGSATVPRHRAARAGPTAAAAA